MKLIDAWNGTFPFDPSSRLLRRVLLCNAGSSAAAGAMLLAAGPLMAPVMGLAGAGGLLQFTGGALLAFALGVDRAAMRHPVNISAVRTVIVLDTLWVLGSAVLVPFLAHELTLAGEAGIIGVALVVMVWALGQAAGLRRVTEEGGRIPA